MYRILLTLWNSNHHFNWHLNLASMANIGGMGAVQCSAVQCSAVNYSAVHCSVVQCSVVQCSSDCPWDRLGQDRPKAARQDASIDRKIPISPPHHNTTLHHNIGCTTLNHSAPHWTTLHHTEPLCTTLHHNIGCPTLNPSAPHHNITLHHTAPSVPYYT